MLWSLRTARQNTNWLLLAVVAVLAFFGFIKIALAQAADAVCAEVKIVIEQKFSLERQAFDARMVITNGLTDQKLENVIIELRFLDANNSPVSVTTDPAGVGSSFFYRTDVVDGIGSLNGGEIAAKSVANISWLIIPSAGTGGTSPEGVVYYIGAKVTYTLNGKTDVVDVAPEAIVVRPQPELVLDYFMPRDVYGDDAFTPEIEPSESFTLGVRIKNEGGGVARNTKIDTAQPKIVDNRQGLLIAFQILSGFVGNQAVGKSLLLDFGDIPPGLSQMGRWSMTSSLAGKFVDFSATFTHADSLGGAVTSLIKAVRTHALLQDVRVDLPGRDDVRDFLAKDGDVYRVYESSGVDTPVLDQTSSAQLGVQGDGANLMFNPVAQGFVYAKVTDPYRGAKVPVQVTRSDGYLVPAENVWLSKVRNDDLSWSYYLNIFDANSTGKYTMRLVGSATQASIEGSVFDDRNMNGVRDSGEAGIGALSVQLTGTAAGTGASVLNTGYTDSQGAFKFSGLPAGTYALATTTSDGLVDGAALVGTGGGLSRPGKISGVALVAGTQATGYLFSKHAGQAAPAQPELRADVSVTVSATPSVVKKTESTSIVITARNVGPGLAAGAIVHVELPVGLAVLSGTTGTGSYNDGQWILGDLAANAEATLRVVAQPASDASAKQFSMVARIGSNAPDDVATNNSASTLIKVEDVKPLTESQSLDQGMRVLAWAGCVVDSACAAQRQQAAQVVLARSGAEAHVAIEAADFKKALRAGDFSVLWLSGPADELSPSLMEEVRAAVYRGASLLIDGQPGVNLRSMQDLWGGYAQKPLAAGAAIQIGFDSIALQSTAWELTPVRGASIALPYVSGQTAAVAAPYGKGRVVALGFDTLDGGPSAPAWLQWMDAQWTQLIPPLTDPMLAQAVVRLKTSITSTSTQLQRLELATTLSHDMRLILASPPAAQAASRLSWSTDLVAGATQTVAASLALPSASVATAIETQLRMVDDAALVESWSQPVHTVALVEAAANTRQASVLLNVSAQRHQAISALLDDADAALKNSQVEQALSALIELQQQLRAYDLLGSEAAVLQSLAQEIGLASMQWQPVSTPISDPQLVLVSGNQQSTTLGHALADTLQVRAIDANSDPISGKVVRFSTAASGPSVVFSNGGLQISATTDAQGLANSGPVVANQTAGSLTVIASLEGSAKAVQFSLSNVDPTAVTLSIQALSGGSQKTSVETSFAAPLQVKVTNAQGLAVSGETVTFTLPSSGAAGVFVSGDVTARVPTNASGIATSPAFAANATQGVFQAHAMVVGGVGAAAFDLENLPVTASSLILQAVSGQGQTAIVGTTYPLPLRVKLTDASGAPVAGHEIAFALHAQSAGATFVGGATSVRSTTDALGVALTPLLVANQMAGEFEVVVTATGAAAELRMRLENTAAVAGGREVVIATPTGTGLVKVAIAGGGATCRFDLTKTTVKKAEGWLPLFNVLLFPHGVLEYELIGCDTGSTVTVTTEWPNMLGVNNYLKFGPTPNSRSRSVWYVPKNLKIVGKQVSYTITDGGLGDDDLLANGVIKDPGGVVVQNGPLPGAQQITAVPGLSPATIALLSSTLLGMGWFVRRRRQRRGCRMARDTNL